LFENRVPRIIMGHKRAEVIARWRKLHSEELLNMFSSSDPIRVIKSRRMKWIGHVARMGDHLGDIDVDGRSTIQMDII
jgi:hypothetical protein